MSRASNGNALPCYSWVDLTLSSALLYPVPPPIGRGSFATVNMASISGQQAAIKCMRKTRLRIEKQGSFVQREREILRRLCTPAEDACPLIIKCFGTAQDDESVS
jgi:serine/threonine protein kinase